MKYAIIPLLLAMAIISGCDASLWEPKISGPGAGDGITISSTAFRVTKVLPNGALTAPRFSQTKIMTSPSMKTYPPNQWVKVTDIGAVGAGDSTVAIAGVTAGTYRIALYDTVDKVTTFVIQMSSDGGTSFSALHHSLLDILSGVFYEFTIAPTSHVILQQEDNSDELAYAKVSVVADHTDILGYSFDAGTEQIITPSASFYGSPQYGGADFPDASTVFTIPRDGLWGFGVTAIVSGTTLRRSAIEIRVRTWADRACLVPISDDTLMRVTTLANGITVTADSLSNGFSFNPTITDTTMVVIGGN